MSERQERARIESWKAVHEATHEKNIAELQGILAKLETIDSNSDEYKKLKEDYEHKHTSAWEFFNKFHES